MQSPIESQADRQRTGLDYRSSDVQRADMTKALKKAFEAASKLPEAEQDALAAAILEELASERRWDELFERSADTLAKLANEALAEDRAGRTRPLDELL